MREIKFRGKRLDNEEWVHGDLLQIVGGFVIYHGSHTDSTLIEDRPNLAVELYMDEVSPVHPDTVGQFTGLYDFYGKEIYEGDIIESGYDGSGMDYRKTVRHMVGYNPKDASFTAEFIGAYPNCGSIRQSWINQFGKRIVGNIHDNPELLKGGQNGQTAE